MDVNVSDDPLLLGRRGLHGVGAHPHFLRSIYGLKEANSMRK